MASVVISGDTSGAITVSAPAVAGTNTLTLPAVTDTLTGIAATQTLTNKTLTSPTLTTPALGTPASGILTSCTGVNYDGYKNRIINGAMVLDQRNAGASVTPTDGAYTLDRWQASVSQTSKYTVQQNAGAVTPPAGFVNYLGVTSSSTYAVLAGDYFSINQCIEGFNSADLAWGTASAATVTLSFRVYSSLTGTFGGVLRNSAATRSYPFTYTVSTANTWTTISVTIAGDTSGTWLTTNGIGIRLLIGLGVGSTYSGTAGAWSANNYFSATGATSVVGTNGATFYITGVQLEKGSTATSFDYRPYTTELQLCQRYYAKLGANASGSSGYQAYGAGHMNSANTQAEFHLPFPQFMRAAPTIAFSGSIGISANGSYINVTSIAGTYAGVSSALLQTSTGAIGSAGQGAVLLSNSDATAYISLTSEL